MSSPRADIFMPHHRFEPDDPLPTALFYGTLLRTGPCLIAFSGQRGGTLLLLWPMGYTITGDDMTVRDANGRVVAQVNRELGVAGGEIHREQYVEENVVESVPPECRIGAYWVVSGPAPAR